MAGRRLTLVDSRRELFSGESYDQVAREQQDMGRRMPSSFDVPAGQRGRRSMAGKLGGGIHQDLGSGRSVYDASSIAGLHQTYAGTTGAAGSDPYNWDARHRFGYGELGARGSGFSDRWDAAKGRERTAGRLEKVGAFDQTVRPERPYLQLRARATDPNGPVVEAEGSYEGNALIRITAGNFQDGQGVQRREFWLGGGFVAAFDLNGWNNVKINILEILDGTFVEFAWTKEGLAGSNRTLYYPETYTTSALSAPVPEGAYAVSIENPAPATPGTTVTVEWIGQLGGSVFTFSQWVSDNSAVAFPRPYAFFADEIDVRAPTFRIAPTVGAPATMGDTVDLLWSLRPI